MTNGMLLLQIDSLHEILLDRTVVHAIHRMNFIVNFSLSINTVYLQIPDDPFSNRERFLASGLQRIRYHFLYTEHPGSPSLFKSNVFITILNILTIDE